MWLVGILVAVALGYVWMRVFLPSEGVALDVALGAALGTGATGCLYFLMTIAGLAGVAWVTATEVALLACGTALFLRRRKPPLPAAGEEGFDWNWALGLALAGCLALFLMSLADAAQMNPQGEWDAWAIWNLRAKFLAGGPATWRYAVSPWLSHTHPEYPLLVSACIARLWTYAGGETAAVVPMATALLFLAIAGGVLIAGLARLRGTSAGLLAGLVLMASELYLSQVASQYADVPLSAFLLAALVMVSLKVRDDASGAAPWCLAGAFASFAAWTKNEGILFVIFLAVSYGAVRWRRDGLRGAGALALGAAPIMALVAWFKFVAVPVVDLPMRQTGAQMASKLIDAGRYIVIVKAFLAQLVDLGKLYTHPLLLLAILYFALRTRASKPPWEAARVAFLTLGLMLAAYAGVFLITPADLAWHMDNSLGRLYGQLWPGVLLAIFLALPRVEDLAVVHQVAGKRKRGKR